MNKITVYAVVGCMAFFAVGLILINVVQSQNILNGILCFALAGLGVDAGAVYGLTRKRK